MATNLVEQKGFTIQPITYPVMVEQIQQLSEEYMPLTVADINDREGLSRVHDARMHVKRLRNDIEKRRKDLKAESLEYGRKVDSAARHLTELIQPIESHLEKEESIVQREKERIQREAEDAKRRMVVLRTNKVKELAFPAMHPPFHAVVEGLPSLDADEFAALVESLTEQRKKYDEQLAAQEAERARLAEQQRIESERLAAERAEVERVRREQAEAQAKIDSEARRLAAEEAERLRQAELAKAREEAAARAKREAEEAQARKEAEAKATADAEEAERKRVESLRPDHEKLLGFADMLAKVEVPELSAAASAARSEVITNLSGAVHNIRAIAHGLVAKYIGANNIVMLRPRHKET